MTSISYIKGRRVIVIYCKLIWIWYHKVCASFRLSAQIHLYSLNLEKGGLLRSHLSRSVCCCLCYFILFCVFFTIITKHLLKLGHEKTSNCFWSTLQIEMLTPKEYIGSLMELAQDRRGEFKEMEYVTEKRASITYELPLAEVIFLLHLFIFPLIYSLHVKYCQFIPSFIPYSLELGLLHRLFYWLNSYSSSSCFFF